MEDCILKEDESKRVSFEKGVGCVCESFDSGFSEVCGN